MAYAPVYNISPRGPRGLYPNSMRDLPIEIDRSLNRRYTATIQFPKDNIIITTTQINQVSWKHRL